MFLMRKTTEQFLKLFFNPEETICVSDCQGGYHSISQKDFDSGITLISPKEDKVPRTTSEERIQLVAINPVNGWRRDENTTAYRTFMVECDDMNLKEQLEYIKKMEFPFSYCCFSGNKSLHFALVLDQDLPSDHIYRYTYQWILNILDKADQKTKNPTRSIRFPDVVRSETGKVQALYKIGERISIETLNNWLNKYPHKKPEVSSQSKPRSQHPNFEGIKPWVAQALIQGIHNMEGSRNQRWMSIGCEFALNGYDLDATLYYLEQFFEEQSDFKHNEWKTAVTSGWNYADKIAR